MAQEVYTYYNHSTTSKHSESASTTLIEAGRKCILTASETRAAVCVSERNALIRTRGV